MSSFKCKLNLTEKTGAYLAEAIIEKFGGKSAISEADSSLFSSVSTSTEASMYKMKDDYYDEYNEYSYYLRGAKDELDNNVIFAEMQWKIIRVNGDGSVRLIYNGTEAQFNTNGTVNTTTNTKISTRAFNSNINDNAYFGYMYGAAGASDYDTANTNTNDSKIKTVLDNWYETNILDTTYESYISDILFCNDRSYTSGNGYGTSSTYYSAYTRLSTNKTPQLKCTNTNDQFTVNASSEVGNGALTYPIGLITADEVALAGALSGSTNTTFYLYTGQAYWTNSPNHFFGLNALVWYVNASGGLSGAAVSGSNGVRPVINLTSDTMVSGSGTATDPYIVL